MTARPSWYEARAIAAAVATALPFETVPLESGIGRRLADDLVSPIDLPHFASAAMDGWQVVGDGPWRLVTGAPTAGQAAAIVTGALVPDGSTAVLRSENGAVADGVLRSTVGGEPQPAQHIRRPGREAVHGEQVVAAGTLLNPAHVALAAATGADELTVQAVAPVAFVFTGDEVVTEGVPPAGRVRDSFGVQLPALIRMLGGRAAGAVRVGDRLDDTVAALRDADAPLIVTTGGTGTSAADHVRDALRALGARILVDGVAMRPGGPTRIARLPDGRLVAALPGNPLAAMLAAITLLEPLIAGLAGRLPVPTRLVAGATVDGRPGVTTLAPYADVDGRAVVATWRGAAMLRGLAGASGILVVPPKGLTEGELAESLDVPWRRLGMR
ncbi:MAG: molybdopterin molybdotransferase MoeA [Leifsonia sp.]